MTTTMTTRSEGKGGREGGTGNDKKGREKWREGGDEGDSFFE